MRKQICDLALDAGLDDVAELAVIDNLGDYQMSRGIGGFYQNALITQKREWFDKSPVEKKTGLIKKIFGRTQEQEKNEMLQQ